MTYTSKHAYGLFGIQSAYETPVSATKDLGLIQSVTASAKHNLQDVYTLSTRLKQAVFEGLFDGALEMELDFQHGRIFELLAGTTVGHATTGSDTVHTIVDVANTKPVAESGKTFTYEDGYNSTSDIVFTYTGVNIASLTVSLDVGGRLKVRWSGAYQDVNNTTSASSAVVSTLAILPSFYGTVSAGTEGSESALSKVQSAEITFETGLTAVPQLGSREKAEEVSNEFNIRYRMTIAFDSITEQQRFLDGGTGSATTPDMDDAMTAFGFVLDVGNGISLGSGLRKFLCELRGCKHDTWSNPVNLGANFIIQEFAGTATQLYKLETTDNIASGSW